MSTTRWTRLIAPALVALLQFAAVAPARGQVPPPAAVGVWQGVAIKLGAGANVTMRLHNGQRFRATLVEIQGTQVLVLPKTRVPVAVQPVPYDAIVSLAEEPAPAPGMSAGKKAAIIGGATGGGVFLLILLAHLVPYS